MPTNFDFLKSDPQFACFAKAAVQAEMVLFVSPWFFDKGCQLVLELSAKSLYNIN